MTKHVTWGEGLFVQPHHFQQHFNHLQQAMGGLVEHYQPHYTGVAKLAISESDCENANLLITEIDARFPSGERLTFPGNAIIEARGFTEQLDANKGRLDVYLALPILSDREPNALRADAKALGGAKYRYRTKYEKVADLVDGGNEREIEVQYLNPKILFGDESAFGYETLHIAVIERSGAYGSVPKLDPEFAPPCIAVEASPLLLEIKREVGNRLISKNRSLRGYWKSKDTASMMKARDALKVQSLAVAANTFIQFSSLSRVHPFTLYTQLAQVIGMLSPYADDDSIVDVPAYDHENLGDCFRTAHRNLVKLLGLLEEASYESRVFEAGDDMLVCNLEPRWLEERFELYLCFESGDDEAAVTAAVGGLKIAPANLIPVLNKRRIRGMNIDGPLHQISRMPTSGQHHYFKIPRDHTYFPKLVEHPTLGIWGAHQFADIATLYVVEKK